VLLPLIILVVLISFGYLYYIQHQASQHLAELQNSLTEHRQTVSEQITDIETVLLASQEENVTFLDALTQAQDRSQNLESQFKRVVSNVENLEKITTTDRELLQKYSKVFFLNEHYAPPELTTIPPEFTYNPDRTYRVHAQIWPYLNNLLQAARRDGMDLQVISAFRSFGEQSLLKGAYTVTYGAGSANQFSADQGYSEHQLGTAIDFTNSTVAATFSGFAASREYKWLQENAHRYGFILSYPPNNEYYQFEPWHWRFVGTRLARDLHRDGEFFYDLPQRTIDTYIVHLFD